jgi:hypothetical protein
MQDIRGYDIPYLVNRITRVLSESDAERLSPWGIIKQSNVKDDFGVVHTMFNGSVAMLSVRDTKHRSNPNSILLSQ